MSFVAALVVLHGMAFIWTAIDDRAGAAVLALVECAAALAALALPKTRRAMLGAVVQYWPAAAAFALLAALAAAGVLHPAGASAAHAPRADAWRLISFGMGVLAATAGALSAPRRFLQSALMIATIALAALALTQRLGNAAPPADGAAFFTLTAALSLYGVIDALTVRQSSERRSSRAERLFLPATALLASLTMLAGPGAPRTFAVLAGMLALLAAGLVTRERRSGSGLILLSAGAAFSALASAGLFYISGSASALTARAQQPWLFSAVWTALFCALALTKDRRRRPSRGFALAVSGAALTAFSDIGPAAFAMLALLLGVALAKADALVSSE